MEALRVFWFVGVEAIGHLGLESHFTFGVSSGDVEVLVVLLVDCQRLVGFEAVALEVSLDDATPGTDGTEARLGIVSD